MVNTIPTSRPDSYPGLRPPSTDDRKPFAASIKSKLLQVMCGLLIGVVAASGLLLVRVLNGGTQAFLPRLLREITTHPSSYAYVVLACGWTMILAAWWFGRREESLLVQANTDPMTSLYNRGYFTARLTEEISRSLRYCSPLSLLMVDLDHLKRINDAKGHRAGDEAILSIASVLEENLRKSDVAARIGGDEFAVILPHTTSEEAVSLAERIREGACSQSLSTSIGVADLDRILDPRTDLLLEAADRALYLAKRRGRNQTADLPFPDSAIASPG